MPLLANFLGPRQAFDGGLFLPDQKSLTARRPIETLSVDGPLNVPLTVRADLNTRPIVTVGQGVVQGQRLAEAIEPDALPVHSPCPGTVVGFSRAYSPFDEFLPSVIIEPGERGPIESACHGWDDESVIGQLAGHGVMCPHPRMPLHSIITKAVEAGVTELIINAMETEPHLVADLRTVVEMPGRLIDTACELGDALGVARVVFAVPFRHRRVMRRLKSEAEGRMVEIFPMADPYPQCHPILLVKAVLGREVPPGAGTLDEGALVLPLAAVRDAGLALFDDKSVTQAVLTLAGDAVEHAGAYRVAVGTPIQRLARRVGLIEPVADAVCGGPLTGISIGHPDAVVTADMSAILLFSKADKAEATPCIRCGWCVEDCPVGLAPLDLLSLERKSRCSPVELYHLRACIDCGLCSHVCPSRLPLAETIRDARRRFSTAGATDSGRRP